MNNYVMKNIKQQTAVEWLIEQVKSKEWQDRYIWHKEDVFKQAKEMHTKETEITENTSDGYHTFKELYEFRKAYNVALFNEFSLQEPKYNVHKSWRHYDGELCFGGGWFIVVAVLPNGQISNHYEACDWDLFKIPVVEKALFEFDGHTGDDVLIRLLKL